MGKFNLKDISDFNKVKEEAEIFYKNIGEIWCPYFNGKISFNSKGLRHLKFKSDQKARSHNDQYSRLKLLKLAPEILKITKTVQGIWNTKKFEELKSGGEWSKILKPVMFYEFVAVLDNTRAKVIVKEVDGGEKYFWSVIPFWGINKEASKRILHSGNPEDD